MSENSQSHQSQFWNAESLSVRAPVFLTWSVYVVLTVVNITPQGFDVFTTVNGWSQITALFAISILSAYILWVVPKLAAIKEQTDKMQLVPDSVTTIQAHTQSLIGMHDDIRKLGSALTNLGDATHSIKQAVTDRSVVEIEGADQRVWKRFTDTYYAFNPSFGSDVLRDGIANEERVEMHRHRYGIGGVERAEYYLYEGDGRSNSPEIATMARFICLIREADRRSPEHEIRKTKVRVHLMAGSRPNTSFFYGTKMGTNNEKYRCGIIYVTNDHLKICSDGLSPNLLFVTEKDETVRDRLDFSRKHLIEQSARVRTLSFYEFEDEFMKLTNVDTNAKAVDWGADSVLIAKAREEIGATKQIPKPPEA